jgi:peptidyl-prolyl cis-trans isomerase B (cyclophilin B)
VRKPFPALAAAALLAAGSLAACAQPGAGPTPTAAGSSPAGDVTTCAYNVSGQAARPVDPPPTTDVPASGTVTVTLQFEAGPVTIELDRGHAPCTVNSFLSLLDQGYYTDTACHRLVTSGIFVLQCGDPSGTGAGGPGYSYADETYSDDTYPAGAVAMANAGPNTNGSQFFFVFEESGLSPDYTVFGHLDSASIAVVRDIALQGHDGAYDPSPGGGHPLADTTILGYSKG